MAITKIVLLMVCCELQFTLSHITIPEPLRECYRSDATLNPQFPLNLRTVVDIIQKLEKHSYASMNMRMLSSSLLHRFKFDGIEFQENIQATNDVLPFGGTGSQRVKNQMIEELIPSNTEALPVHVLTRTERCILHQAISNTIIKHDVQNVNKSCHRVIQTEKQTGKNILTDTYNCPRQQGVILTPYGTVALGSIIGAIAASLQHQNVALNQLIASLGTPASVPVGINATRTSNTKYDEEEIDFVLPKSQMIHEQYMWYRTLMSSSVELDNVWLTTIAGDLAEMTVYQGPLIGNNMSLGATGFWNNTMYPTVYYLTSEHTSFEATRAELLGGIDGLIIASNLQTWIQKFYSLRLSQILNMYYSYEGIAFDVNVKACNRAQHFVLTTPKTILNEQINAIAQMLAYRKSIAYISPEALQRMTEYATEKFYAYAENHLFPEIPCREPINQNRVEALIVFDGAWAIEYTTNFLAVLIQDLDVSMYGSKMGIIHGTSGEWLLNVTNSPSLAFEALNNFTNISWPTQLNYTRVLETIFAHLNKTWEDNRKLNRIGNLGQVIVLLIPLSYMSANDRQFIITLLQEIKYHHPDVHFVYYTSRYNTNLFNAFILSHEDHLINNSNIDDVIQHLSIIPRTLRPIKYIDSNSKNSTLQFEDYISPSKSIVYRLHSYWKRNIKRTPITIHNFDYGKINVCTWIQYQPGERQNYNCTEMDGYKEITLIDQLKCTKDLPCPDIYFRIQNVTSHFKCAEIDCRTPDQVRFIIRSENFYYESSANKNVPLFVLNVSLLFVYYVLSRTLL
ncbi:uncharacterized protein LOC128887365 [Hylaeus anthracinus]|uniref:uncharacterized protein LOC128887365 n=1 Tax=Hylaeus anthracinus TaxID=313031 RepID=UPI0023B8CCF8|nr:uncharacterized protein LOC128887365 [Hylaeus anthracinus]